jgi:hypothetical protein
VNAYVDAYNGMVYKPAQYAWTGTLYKEEKYSKASKVHTCTTKQLGILNFHEIYC